MRPIVSTAVAIFALMVVATLANEAHRVTSIPGYPELRSKNYAGYVPVGDRKAFYYFIESQNKPSTDPLVLWLNGGPGCSSMLGLFTEIGPYLLRNGGDWDYNSYHWATEANVLFVESPPGVGFSKDRVPATNWTDELTAQVNYEFLINWLAMYPPFAGRDFYITGESYAGHYIPQLASKIQHGANVTLRNMMKGFAAGNPCTGTANGDGLDWCFTAVDPTLAEYNRSHAFQSYDPAIPTATTDYDPYNILVRTCQWKLDKLQVKWHHHGLAESAMEADHRDIVDGADATTPRENIILPYGPCSENYLTLFLNRRDVQAALNADVGTTWSACNESSKFLYPTPVTLPGVMDLYQDMMANTDWKLMIYSGDADTVVNFIQSEKVVMAMNRAVVSKFTPWYYRDVYNGTWKQLGGFYVEYDRITWASVKGAGHMVPQYVPAAAFQLLKSFISTGTAGLQPVLSPYAPPTPSANPNAGSSDNARHDVGLFFGGVVSGVALVLILLFLYRTVGGGGDGRKRSAMTEEISYNTA